jgi:hypothetical protein
MAAGRHAGGNTATHLEDGNLVAPFAGVNAGHCLGSMSLLAIGSVNPTGWMVVAVILGHAEGFFAAPATHQGQGAEQDNAKGLRKTR